MQACNLNIEAIWMFCTTSSFWTLIVNALQAIVKMSWMIKLVNFVRSYEIYFMIMKAKFIYHGSFDVSYIIWGNIIIFQKKFKEKNCEWK